MPKLNFSKESIIGIFINILIANSGLLVFITIFSTFFDGWKTPLSSNMWLTYLFIVLIIYILKFSLLPLYYLCIDKYSKNEYVIDFLSKLKAEKKSQNKFLASGIVIDFIFILLNVIPISIQYHYNFSGFITNLLIWATLYIITGAGLFGSYFTLFSWWKVKNK